jgi:CHAT domain-containing protein/Flp pilus assembly protein TadD
LRFLGEVEKARFGDNLALDLAEIYDGASEERLRAFSDAHARVRNGYQLCLMGKYTAAAAEFQSAQHLFLRASNPAEAEVICAYFLAYCLYVTRDYVGAQVLLKNVDSFATAKGYRWSQLMNYYWLLGAEQSVEHKSLTEIRLEYEAELKKAEEMEDAHMIQKFLLALITKSSFAHLQDRAARYIHRLLTYCARPGLSVRQKARNYEVIIQVTDADQFPAFAKALVRENVKNSESIKDDPAFELSAEVSAGIVNTQTGDFDAAESWFRRAREKAELLPDETPRRENVGNILLNLGNLERGRKNYRRAMDYYDESLRTTENLALPLMHYEITKARLMSFEALDDDASIEREVPAAIGLAESYRRTLLEEQERNGFFESEDEVYDVAIRHELRNNRFENAYNYAEASSSRSLLDLIAKRSNSNHLASDGVYFDGSTTPVLINEIRESIPQNVQVVQFRILRGETIIWVISRHEFQTFVSTISAVDLKAKVDDYMRLVQNKDSAAQDSAREIAHELYTILIGPVRASLKGESYLCIIPNRFLYNLPFASLASADGKYLIEEFALLYSPSANVFSRCSKNADLKSEKQPERVLSVGDPSFDRQQYPDLSRLPEASEEAQMIAADYSSRVVLKGPAATAEAFKSSYKEFEVIHVAAHYVVDSRDPYSSKLIMARAGQDAGFVRHADLMQGQLERAKLVVLSACQSGVENYYAGEGPVGLSRTFLAIGVPLVVASAWSVDSPATNRLMQRFHSLRTKEKLTTVESLREAQLSLIRDADSPYRQPYFWAAFAAHGGAASF